MTLVSRNSRGYITSNGIQILGLPASYASLELPVIVEYAFGPSYTVLPPVVHALRVCSPIPAADAYYISMVLLAGSTYQTVLTGPFVMTCGTTNQKYYTDTTGRRYFTAVGLVSGNTYTIDVEASQSTETFCGYSVLLTTIVETSASALRTTYPVP